MSRFVDISGKSTFGIGICDRCRKKFSLTELRQDKDNPGLLVCAEDRDEMGQDRMKPRKAENFSLRVIRTEASIALTYVLGGDGLPIVDADGYYVEA